MEIFAAVFNEMKKELRAKFGMSSFVLVRATETHTAWHGEGQNGRFMVVRDNETGEAKAVQTYDWFSK